MVAMNIFSESNKAWDTTELSGLVRNKPSMPGMIGSMNLFTDKPVRQKNVFIDETEGTLKLIGFSERGGEKEQAQRASRRAISFEIPRLAQEGKIWATSIAGLRATGTETELMAVQSEVNDLMTQMNDNLEYTDEYLKLAAVQGKVLDPSDGSVYLDYFTAMNIAKPATKTFNFSDDAFDVKTFCEEIMIDVKRTAKGAWVEGVSKYIAPVGDAFWFSLVNHPTVTKFYEGYSAMMLLKGLSSTDEFELGGITFRRYIGSDDNAEIAVATGEGFGFIQGGRDVFQKVMAPADEHFSYVNTKGQSKYVITKRDVEYPNDPRWMGFDLLAYPLYMCTRPNTLRTFATS